MQTDKDRWIASMRQEIDAMNKAFYATYEASKEDIAAQYPAPTSDYDDLLEVCQGWDDEAFEEDTIEDIETCFAAGDETLARLLRESENANKRIAEHCRMKLEERAKPSTMQKLDAKLKSYLDVETMPFMGVERAVPLRGLAAWLPTSSTEDALRAMAYGIPPAAERPCPTCSKPNDVGVKTCWCCGNTP